MNWLKKILGMEPDKLFYPGQEITPRVNPTWSIKGTHVLQPGPKFGEIVKVIRYARVSEGQWYIQITSYGNYFDESQFAPVITNKQLEEMLQEVGQLTIAHGTF